MAGGERTDDNKNVWPASRTGGFFFELDYFICLSMGFFSGLSWHQSLQSFFVLLKEQP